MDAFTMAAALGPLVLDLGKSLISRFIGGGFVPSNIGEWVQVQRLEVEKFVAINAAGGGGASFPWVEAVIRLQRPMVAGVALSVWAYTRVAGVPSEAVDNFAAAVGFYLFGDRTLFHARLTK